MRQVKNFETLAVGCGAGFSGDRVDAPVSEVTKWTRLTKEAGIEPE